ncbi:MAG: imidazole glycerol phosphate synthase subunit HisH [Planctomycetota bacterium]
MNVHLVKTGIANVASVTAALKRLGATVTPTADPGVIASAAAVVLPGVGAFRAGMETLKERGLAAALRTRIHGDQPTLAVCLGLQLLTQASDEAPGVRGLGVLPVSARKLEGAPRLPHFGWNRVRVDSGPEGRETLLRSGDAYFAHTFGVVNDSRLRESGWTTALTTEGTTFVSAVERGSVLACQFHPELSGAFGADLIQRWMTRAAAAPRSEEAVSW